MGKAAFAKPQWMPDSASGPEGACEAWVEEEGSLKLAVGRREPVAEREVDAGAFHGAVEVRGCVLGRTWLRRKHGAAAALTLSLFIHTVASEANGFVRGYFGLACCVCCS